MNIKQHYFGIDFGTTYSSMAWYDANKAEAKIILNDHDEAKTPSLVFFGQNDEILVGRDAENKVEEFETSTDPDERNDANQRIVRSIKRSLLYPPVIPVPGYGEVRPVEVVALILGKLKLDAEENHFYEEIERVVLTHPAVFGSQEREALREAAVIAGFKEVELFEEPAAAAVAFARRGQKVGEGVLVYDLGAGTFDLAVVERDDEGEEQEGSFWAVVETQGDSWCGGDDLDQALYDYCDRIAREKLGRPISLTGGVDKFFLRHCRRRKESLSRTEKSKFSSYLPSGNGSQLFVHEVDRETFEGLIRGRIEGTVARTVGLLEQARGRGHEVDAVVLIGGSSQVPLVERMLKEARLPVRKFQERAYAVALGAAYHAHELWKIPGEEEAPRKQASRGGAIRKEATRVGESDKGGRDTRQDVERHSVTPVYKLLHHLTGHSGWAKSVVFSPDGRLLASGGGYRDGTIKLWDLQSGEELRTLSGHSDSVESVAFRPDGGLLASGGRDNTGYNTVQLWDAKSGEALQTLSGHSGLVLSVAFSPDGCLLASGSQDGTIRLRNPRSGELLRTLSGRSDDPVYSVAFSPDGHLLASGGLRTEERFLRKRLLRNPEYTKTLSENCQVEQNVCAGELNQR